MGVYGRRQDGMPDSFQLDQGVIFRGLAEWSGMRQVGTVIRGFEVL